MRMVKSSLRGVGGEGSKVVIASRSWSSCWMRAEKASSAALRLDAIAVSVCVYLAEALLYLP